MRQRGLTLVELLLVMAIIGMFTAIAMPNWIALHRRSALRAAALEFTSLFRAARMRAIVSAKSSGVKFTKAADGTWLYTVYEDGNGDGVRNADISSGADHRITKPKRVLDTVRFVSVGVPSKKIVDPDGGPLRPTDSPVQFGTSFICSFSPLGAATSGTIYLTDTDGGAWCVRVYGASAKVRMLRWTGTKWVAA